MVAPYGRRSFPRASRCALTLVGAAVALGVLPSCDSEDAAGDTAVPQSETSGSQTSGADSLYTTGISASASEGEPESDSETEGDDTSGDPPDPTDTPPPGPDCDDQTPCSDGDDNPCTVPRCDDGTCVEEPLDCQRDSNACADAACDPASGECTYTPNDGACGVADTCSTPRCDVTLDDEGAFVEATCDPGELDGRSCDDEDPCTTDDVCGGGACEGLSVSCDTPPEPMCAGAMLQTFAGGSCSAGDCTYDTIAFSCPDGCAAGACQGPAHPLISEVLYDDEGTDDNVWIEVWAPPGSSLDGVLIEFVNGSSGAVGDTYPLSGTTPADGIVLIVSDDATSPSLLAAADFVDGIADLQNGPDNVRLRQGELILDALGYGSFDADETFAGEGSPTSDVSPDRSLARSMSVIDTDNNAADFSVETEPTPGALNP